MRVRTITAAMSVGFLLLAGSALAQTAASPQPEDAQLQPGLNATFLYDDFQVIDKMPTAPEKIAKGKYGKPVANLDASSQSGELWDAGAKTRYGAYFTGLVKLPAGKVVLSAISNDGVRVMVGGVRVLNDPEPHPDRRTESAPLNIATAGWYPILVQYFQRNGKARLTVSWQVDGGSETVIPPEAFARLNK